MSHNKKLLIGVSGSIAAYKIATVISYFRKKNWEVRCLATPSALKFIGEATLEGLSGNPVLTSDFTSGHMMSHIDLARWADVFILAPATAKTLAGLATGAGEGILHTTYLAYETHKPLLIAPAMNTQMLSHPATQFAIQTLKDRGAKLLSTGSGLLACGENGDGRMMEPEDIITHIEKAAITLQKQKSVLITTGGTRVPIDSVRSITNASTGKTGSLLADALAEKGYRVTALVAKSALRPRLVDDCIEFDTFDEFQELLKKQLSTKTFSTVVHMAAVSDFAVDKNSNKLPSDHNVDLKLKPTPKLICLINELSPKALLVGFKLTVNAAPIAVENAVETVFKNGADVVIHNDLSEITTTSHRLTLHTQDGPVKSVSHSHELVELIESAILHNIDQKNFPEVTL